MMPFPLVACTAWQLSDEWGGCGIKVGLVLLGTSFVFRVCLLGERKVLVGRLFLGGWGLSSKLCRLAPGSAFPMHQGRQQW